MLRMRSGVACWYGCNAVGVGASVGVVLMWTCDVWCEGVIVCEGDVRVRF